MSRPSDAPGPVPLEPSAEQVAELTAGALALIQRHLAAQPEAPAADLEGALELARAELGPPPEQGRPFDELLRRVERCSAKAVNTSGPSYLAYIPAGGLFSAALAEFVAAALNRYVGVWQLAPALAALETSVVRWLCDLFHFPDEARGVLTSGGSLANFSALVTARDTLLGEDFASARLYVSAQVHASVTKAARLAGLPRRAVCPVPCTPELRLDPVALARLIAEDRAAGLRPFCVVASAGTTNTGAVDPLAELAALCRREGLWLHVDGAYGGFFQLTEEGQRVLAGIEEADSITLDPHKGLFLPYGCGALLVRRGEALRRAHAQGAEYLQDLADDALLPSFADHSPELSRSFRGLRVWLPLHLHGVAAFRAALDEKLALARRLYERLRDCPRLELPHPPQLSVVPLRYRPRRADLGPEQIDALNMLLLRRVNATGRVYLSSTRLEDRFTLRACVLSVRTHAERVDEAATILRREAERLER